jgi:hypothetical protein
VGGFVGPTLPAVTSAEVNDVLTIVAGPEIAWEAGGGGGAVSSVFGRTGAVTGQSGDYSAFYDALGAAAAAQAAAEAYANPMTTAGDLIQGGVAGTPARLPLGSANQILGIVSGSAWGAVNPPPALGLGLTGVVDTFYQVPPGGSASGSLSGAQSRESCTPFLVSIPTIIKSVSIWVGTAGVSVDGFGYRVSIRADTGGGMPGNLLLDTGVQALFSLTATGVVTLALTVPLTLTPGLYWVGGCYQWVTLAPTTTPSIYLPTNVGVNASLIPLQGGGSTPGGALAATPIVQTSGYGGGSTPYGTALPTTFVPTAFVSNGSGYGPPLVAFGT